MTKQLSSFMKELFQNMTIAMCSFVNCKQNKFIIGIFYNYLKIQCGILYCFADIRTTLNIALLQFQSLNNFVVSFITNSFENTYLLRNIFFAFLIS